MRCECSVCGSYMAHAEDMKMGCICPACSARCSACLGTDTLLSREELHTLKDDPVFERQFVSEEEDKEL